MKIKILKYNKKVNIPYFIIEYFDDYEVSKSLEKNDINITFIQRNIFQINKIKKLKVFYFQEYIFHIIK